VKLLHRPDLYGWSQFDTSRNIDFNSVLWVRRDGNVVVDPLPLTEHDFDHLEKLGGAEHIILTNSDHIRATRHLRDRTGAKLYAPAAEKDDFPIAADQWLSAGDAPVPGVSQTQPTRWDICGTHW
jgi:glyoxylase-like metal-dependent hydrolase (beta-lactamase superfamily II)